MASGEPPPSRSRFLGKDLHALADPQRSYDTPLATIAHLDLDAFYAQCEQVRLGLPKMAPVVCQQWQGLIAVSYGARRYGISRHETVAAARLKCPHLVAAHVATFARGTTHWEYTDPAACAPGTYPPAKETHKVSLDPYRRESRKIFEILRRSVTVLEKASIDETFMDLGALVHAKMLEKFPTLANIAPDEPLPQVVSLPELTEAGFRWEGRVLGSCEDEYQGEAIGLDLYKEKETTEEIKKPDTLEKTPPKEDQQTNIPPRSVPLEVTDWDDVVLMISGTILKHLRRSILDELGYTCSAGIARTKALAKLASGTLKPATQNIVRAAAIPSFLTRFEITEIGGLGGKLGEHVKTALHLPPSGSVAFIDAMPRKEMLAKLSPQLTKRLKALAQGEEYLQVNTRTDVKSMSSVKNFTYFPLSNSAKAVEWLKVYSADLAGRVVELSEEAQHKTPPNDKTPLSFYPRTISLGFKSKGMPRAQTKQAPFPVGATAATLRDQLFDMGCAVLKELETAPDSSKVKARYPCEMLSLEIHGFINYSGSEKNTVRPISSFFKPRSAVEAEKHVSPKREGGGSSPLKKHSPVKKLKALDVPFLEEDDDSDQDESPGSPTPINTEQSATKESSWKDESPTPDLNGISTEPGDDHEDDDDGEDNVDWAKLEDLFVTATGEASTTKTVECPRCRRALKLADISEHRDWHLARDIARAQRLGNTSLSTFFKSAPKYKAVVDKEKSKSGAAQPQRALKLTTKRPAPPPRPKPSFVSTNKANGAPKRSTSGATQSAAKRTKSDKKQTFLKF